MNFKIELPDCDVVYYFNEEQTAQSYIDNMQHNFEETLTIEKTKWNMKEKHDGNRRNR
jgi:hypothetical protein